MPVLLDPKKIPVVQDLAGAKNDSTLCPGGAALQGLQVCDPSFQPPVPPLHGCHPV
jgi:hypothetical protein